jgi:acyl-coenzyme A synthetase/AMP-(fatty) acid ligase
VELGEVEAALREASGLDGVIATGWPITASGCAGIEAFLEGHVADREALRSAVASSVPEYMVPRRIHCMDRLPRNSSDKLDRKAIITLLKEGL